MQDRSQSSYRGLITNLDRDSSVHQTISFGRVWKQQQHICIYSYLGLTKLDRDSSAYQTIFTARL